MVGVTTAGWQSAQPEAAQQFWPKCAHSVRRQQGQITDQTIYSTARGAAVNTDLLFAIWARGMRALPPAHTPGSGRPQKHAPGRTQGGL